jgi:hypothetical protein
MRLKIIGFKVGQSRPTANRTVSVLVGEGRFDVHDASVSKLGETLYEVLQESDFISIRRVDE